MAKDSDRLRGGFDIGETGGALSGLLAEEDEFDRRTLWRLGTWAAVSVGAVVVALVTNQSSIGMRREQTAAADLIRQTQQAQLAAKESQSEARRLASAIETLNSDRDRLYSRVAVLEQGLDSVTGAIARQAPAPPSQASTGPASPSPASPSQASAAPPANPYALPSTSSPSAAPVPTASAAPAASVSTAPVVTASVDPSPTVAKPSPVAPVVAPVIATAPAIVEKQDKQASPVPPSDPSPAVKSAAAQQQPSPAPPSGSLMAPKSMMGPPDPAAGKLIAPVAPPKTVTAAPMPEVAAVTKAPEETEPDAAQEAPELVARRTEFGVDVGGANSVPGLRALWRGLLKSRSNASLTTLRPIIVIRENYNGLGMQLRLVAGPINDAAAAAKICASLTMNDRGCTTTVFEGQRLTMSADEQAKADTSTSSETKPESDPKSASVPKTSSHRRYAGKHSSKEDEAPKGEPSTLSLIFGKH
jgi:hypothetical protein